MSFRGVSDRFGADNHALLNQYDDPVAAAMVLPPSPDPHSHSGLNGRDDDSPIPRGMHDKHLDDMFWKGLSTGRANDPLPPNSYRGMPPSFDFDPAMSGSAGRTRGSTAPDSLYTDGFGGGNMWPAPSPAENPSFGTARALYLCCIVVGRCNVMECV